jgi:hypothetical protein
MAGFLVPTESSAALASPSLCLLCQPLLGLLGLQLFQVADHVAVVNSAVGLKGLDVVTGELCAGATMDQASAIRTRPDIAR